MVGGALNDSLRWFEEHSAGAPDALRERAAVYARQVEELADPAKCLGRAAMTALARGLERAGDRAAALDLLAADALLTLALLRQATTSPAELASFARELRAAGAAVR